MIVRRFLAWIETASAGRRAEGVSALARAYLYSEMAADERADAMVVLTSILDDASPLVRRALAEAFASAVDAPHHIISSLASDQSDISAVVLSRSPLLADGELIDCAAIGDGFAQTAIARRPKLSSPVSAAVAEVGTVEAVAALAGNDGADVPEFSLRRMLERFGHEAAVREALLSRRHLPLSLRTDLVAATAAALSDFVVARGWLSPQRAQRVTASARERAIVSLADQAGYAGSRMLVSHLRESGALTTGLLLRALLSQNDGLFEAAMIELSGLAPTKVAGLVRECHASGFAALYKRAGLPMPLLPIFRAVLNAARSRGGRGNGSGRLSLVMIEQALAACRQKSSADQHKLLAMLRCFEAEAAREEARQITLDIVCTRKVEEALELRALVVDAPPDAAPPHEWNRAAPVELPLELRGTAPRIELPRAA